jgi:hypothetical protein
MNTKKINKLQEKVAEIIGIYKGGAYEEGGYIFLKNPCNSRIRSQTIKKTYGTR